jgi:hypothetical protein
MLLRLAKQVAAPVGGRSPNSFNWEEVRGLDLAPARSRERQRRMLAGRHESGDRQAPLRPHRPHQRHTEFIPKRNSERSGGRGLRTDDAVRFEIGENQGSFGRRRRRRLPSYEREQGTPETCATCFAMVAALGRARLAGAAGQMGTAQSVVHVNAIARGTRLHAHTLRLGFITRSGRTRQWIAADEQNVSGAP